MIFATLFSQPAFSYWQQKVDHKIAVTLDDRDHILRGYAEMTYTNNSPDTLRYIFMHLYPNAYKHDHTAFAKQKVADGDTKFYYSNKYEKGFIDSLSFTTEDLPMSYSKYNDNEDIIFLELIDPLYPGASIKINTPFRVVIPKTFSRLGHIGQSYQITQWYPKPAVYDKDGWHMMPYLDQGEFFYEYGDYDVAMTLPKNYVVASTGHLQTESEKEFRKLRDVKNATDQQIDKMVIRSEKMKLGKRIERAGQDKVIVPASDRENKTIRFTQNNVHDFAWFADKTFFVSRVDFQLPNNKNCTAYSFITPPNINKFKTSAEALAETTKFLSEKVGAYPYNQISIVDGPLYAGGGMEYPNIAIIGKLPDEKTVNIVIVHEAGHNWFQGILGSNERVHPWLDEGINSFYEAKVVEVLKQKKIPVAASGGNSLVYVLNGHARYDQPIELPADEYTSPNYGGVVYAKAAQAMAYLEDYIGEKDFENGMQEYFQTWKQKHPAPNDMRAALEKNTAKNLDWFFDKLLTSGQPIDYRISKTLPSENGRKILVTDKFGSLYPVPVFAVKGDSILEKTYSKNGVANLSNWGGGVEYVVNKEGVVPEINVRNNGYKPKSFFKRSAPKLGLGTSVFKPGINKAFLLPAGGYNFYDGFMAGVAFHNLKIPNNQFQFAVAPLYSFKSNQLNGTGVVGYSFYPKGPLHKITASVQGGSFSADATDQNLEKAIYPRWYKVNPRLRFELAKKTLRSPVERTVVLNFFHTGRQGYNFKQDSVKINDTAFERIFIPSLGSYERQNLFRLNYIYKNNRTFNPYSYDLQYETTKDISKVAATVNLKIDYFMPKKALYIRAFAGKFFYLNNEASFFDVAPYFLNVTPTAVNDYAYENTFIGRNEREGYRGQQVLDREGGFATRTSFLANPLGRTDDWLAAVNIRTDIPVKFFYLPQLFFNVATFADAGSVTSSGSKTLFEGGLQFNILKEIIKINVPLVLSKDLKDYTQSIYTTNRFSRQISFSLSTDRIDFLRTQERLTDIVF